MPLFRRGKREQPDRTDADRAADLRSVQRQLTAIMSGADSLELRQRYFRDLATRHEESRGGARRFDEARDRYGEPSYVRPGQLLVRSESVDDIAGLVALRRFRLRPVPELRERVTVITSAETASEELVRLAAALRARGIPVSADYMTPNGPVIKSLGGVEPAAGPGVPFPGGPSAHPPVRVVVIDTGIATQRRNDGWVQGVGTKADADPLDELPEDGFLDRAAGHGTFCAGIVQQVAPQAQLLVCRELDSDGVGYELDVATRMVTEAERGLKAGQHVVISLSLGSETADDERPVGFSVALEVIEELQAEHRGKGRHDLEGQDLEVRVVAAAGNHGRTRPFYPAALPGVVAVTALTQGLRPAKWSSNGSWADVCTIGEGVRSTFVQGTESPTVDPKPDSFPADAWALWSGTSFAAPQVAGAIAQIAMDDGVGLAEAERRLLAGAPEVPLYGKRVEILPAI